VGGLRVAVSLCTAVRACLLFVHVRRQAARRKEKGEEKEKEGKENRKKKKYEKNFKLEFF
jgi:hypothetical protein